MKQYNIDFKRISKYHKDDIFEYLCNVEKNIAQDNKRAMAEVILDSNEKTPSYDVKNNIILLPENISNSQMIKLTASISHECEHVNQSLSAIKTKDEKMLFDISMALYQDDGIQYSCNYREIIARLVEAKCILNLYDMALNQVGILNKELAQDFKDAIGNAIKYIKPLK